MGEWTRRRVLQAAAAGGGAVFLPWSGVFAQSDRTALLRVPKQALVIGNSRYRHSPLKNPVNDAKGMAEALKSAGFGVTLALELPRSGTQEAIQSYTESLAKSKAVGLFYFAGHGAQLAWRNYLIPVDEEIGDVQELRERGVDVNSLIEGIRKAGNPMNVIILDACRDNPFGNTAQVEQRGLSQLDAPPGTLLAYATAPGNTAIDGAGEHGLYTEHLLREIKVPEAKVEDVFKRVRLNVRRRSNGRQIPWESTSLEEDFYFWPPKEMKKLADAEAAKQFEEELALWEQIMDASDPKPLEDYLTRYPSGRFSELVQLRLDQVLASRGEKKIKFESSAENPYSKGTAVADTNRRVGDSYTYRVTDLYTNIETERFTRTITKVTDTEVIYDNGQITDLLGNTRHARDGRRTTGGQLWGGDYSLGKRWTSRANSINAKGVAFQTEVEYRVVAREKITIPAGTFDAFLVEGNGWATGGVNTQLRTKRWIAPDQVRAPLVGETLRRSGQRVIRSDRLELVSYRQS